MTKPDNFRQITDLRQALWEINREQVLLLAGGRVLLMQIAHPMVAEAVYNHSYVFDKPLLRLQRTMRLTRTMVFGSEIEIEEATAEIEAAHRPVAGRIEESTGKHQAGASYNARNPRQALWVFATLIEGALHAYDYLVAPLNEATKEAFYCGGIDFAQRMGIPASYLPPSYQALHEYMQQAIADGEVAVSSKAREIAPFITAQSVPVVRYLAYPTYRLSVGLLPEVLREQYGYQFQAWEARLLRGFSSMSRSLVPLLPSIVRYAPEYRRALGRINQSTDL